MISLNNKILISVHYLVEDENEIFWDKDTGYLQKQVHEALKTKFPETIKLPEGLCAKRYSLRHQPIDYPNANLIECPVCKRMITDTTKPRPIYGIDRATEFEGILMCSSCAWQQNFDIQKHTLVSGKPPLPESAHMIQSNEDETSKRIK